MVVYTSTLLLFLKRYYCSFPFLISVSPRDDNALTLGKLKRNGGMGHLVHQVKEIISKEKTVPASINGKLLKNNFKFNFACTREP